MSVQEVTTFQKKEWRITQCFVQRHYVFEYIGKTGRQTKVKNINQADELEVIIRGKIEYWLHCCCKNF